MQRNHSSIKKKPSDKEGLLPNGYTGIPHPPTSQDSFIPLAA